MILSKARSVSRFLWPRVRVDTKVNFLISQKYKIKTEVKIIFRENFYSDLLRTSVLSNEINKSTPNSRQSL
jgi:hypothetical protein